MKANELIQGPLKQLDKALNTLRDLGLVPAKPEEAPIVALINKIADYDENKVAAIARSLSHASLFNEVVREQVVAMKVGERYKQITDAFDSIRDDAKKMVDQLGDGKIDTMERLSNMWMSVTRGDIPSRFAKIKKVYLEVAADTQDQIRRDNTILEAYKDFRGAIKESQVMAFQLLKTAEAALEESKGHLEAATRKLEAGTADGREERARLEMERDKRLRELQDEDKRYQITKDLAENLSVSYNTSEVIMARLSQSTELKERVYSQAVTFFGTNETVFTALNASFTSLQGLHETTRTLDAMKEGINKSLETIAEVGGTVQEGALRAGYGPTLKAESVKKLVEAVVGFQEKSRLMIDEMRRASSRNELEIREAVEDGKRRLAVLQTSGKLLIDG